MTKGVTSSDFGVAAIDVKDAADHMRPYLERLDRYIAFLDAHDGVRPEEVPKESHDDPQTLLSALLVGHRAFFRHLDLYPHLKDEWISRTKWVSSYKDMRGVFHWNIDILDKCASILTQRASLAQVQVPATHYHTYLGEVHVGDVFRDIHNATIINRSKVEGDVNTLAQRDAALGNALRQVEDEIEKSGNAAAGALYENIVKEAVEANPNKGKLKQLWNGIIALAPTVATLAEAAEIITKLFE